VREKLTHRAADGLSTEQMQAYVDTAKAVAEVTGVEMAEALDQIREHFQGGMEDIIALDEETNAFTDSELELIQALYDQVGADEARAAALAIYGNKQQEIADKQRGPWKIAVDQLGQAWNNFTSWLSNTTNRCLCRCDPESAYQRKGRRSQRGRQDRGRRQDTEGVD
jgi:hypothetical protein